MPAPLYHSSDLPSPLPRVWTVTESLLVRVDAQGVKHPDFQKCYRLGRDAALRGGDEFIVLNVEAWPTDLRTAPATVVAESVRKYVDLIRWTQQGRDAAIKTGKAKGNPKIGLYGMVPIRDYWTPNQLAAYRQRFEATPRTAPLERVIEVAADYGRWQQANAALKPIADAADVVVPSLYTFYAVTRGDAGWGRYAEANLAEAARYGKPVLPYLWPQYHNSNAALVNTEIPADALAWEVEVCRGNPAVVGVVLWDWSEHYVKRDAQRRVIERRVPAWLTIGG